jgi:phosphohistidine phosphatase
MSKTVLLLRHAKASREDPEMADFDRPLNARGRQDAPRVGAWMRRSGLAPDLVLCSDAKRARETWAGVAETLRSGAPVLFERGLYMASAKALCHRLQRIQGTVGTVLVVGHNPGIEEAAQALARREGDALKHLQREKLPTAALVRLEFDISEWTQLQPGAGRLTLFKTPDKPD